MTRFTVLQGGGGRADANDRNGRGGGGGNGGEMEINQRVAGLELAQVQIGMDMQFIKGKIEDMPTKDWMNTRLLAYAAGLGTIVVIGLTVIGFLVKP